MNNTLNSLTILQHNVQGWNSKRFQLCNTYREINPDIILLNETNTLSLRLFGYSTYTSIKMKNPTQTVGYGTAILVRNNVVHTVIDDFETDLLAIKIHTTDGPMIVATDYISPSTGFIHYPDYLKLFLPGIPVYLLGDLNARHPSLNSRMNTTNSNGRQLVNLIDRKNLKVLGPTFPTRTDHRSSSILDIVLANEHTFYNYHISPGPHTSSDHIPVILKISSNIIWIPIKKRKQYTKADWDSYENHLAELPLLDANNLTVTQLDTLITQWNNQVTGAIDQYIPNITHRTIPGVKPNNTILDARLQINFMLSIIQTYGASTQAYRTINQQRRRISEEYRALQTVKWDEIVSKLQNEKDPKKFFTGIKRYMGYNKTQNSNT